MNELLAEVEQLLHEQIEQVSILTEHQPKEVFVDLEYRRAAVPDGTKMYHRKLRRGINTRLSRDIGGAMPLNRRSGIWRMTAS